MSDAKMRTYEGMFLLPAGASDFSAASEAVRAVLEREEADLLAINPWDERRLAYEIRGHRRAMYVLTYFKLDPLRVRRVEHECDLDERILRAMILRKDHLSDEELNAETPAAAVERRAAERAEAEAREAEKAAAEAPPAAPPAEDAPAEAPAAPTDETQAGEGPDQPTEPERPEAP